MHVVPVHLDFDVLAGDDERPRGHGVHASDLYNRLFQQLEPKRYGPDEEMNRMWVAAGLGWEWQVERAMRASGIRWTRPPEFQSAEGIYFNPDALVRLQQEWVGEIKLTRMSARAMLSEARFDKWLTQAKFYCNQVEIPRALFVTGHSNGSYPHKGEDPALGQPCMKVTGVEFTPRELRENHEMLLRVGRQAGLL